MFKHNTWVGNRRESDGLRVVSDGSSYRVAPDDGRAAISECPCCSKAFATLRAAQLAADALYPLQPDDSVLRGKVV